MEGTEKKPKAAKGKKEKPIVVTQENLLYQPWKLIKSGYDATAFQQNVIISVLRKLKNSLAAMRDDYVRGGSARQLSLFETADAAIYREEDDAMTFNIHMKELGVEPQNYQRAFNAVCNIGDIDVWVPVPNPDGDKDELERAKLFSIIVNKEDVIVDENNQVIGYKYAKHNPLVKLKLRRNVAETLFQGQIHTFLEETAMNISEKYPKRLYMYFANYKNIGELTIDYWKFRQQIGFEDHDMDNIQYPKFFDFRKRVLDPSVKRLKDLAEKGQAEYWFEYEAIYKGAGRAKAPSTLKFTIHLSQIGEDYENQKLSFKERKAIEDRLYGVFDQTTAQVRRIISGLNVDYYADFNAKLDELERHFEKNSANIKDKRAYANRVLTDFIAETKAADELRKEMERQNENKATNREQDLDSTLKESSVQRNNPYIDDPQNLISDEDYVKIDGFLSSIKNDISRKIVLDALSVKKNETGFYLAIPTRATYEVFVDKWESIATDLSELLDSDVRMRISSN